MMKAKAFHPHDHFWFVGDDRSRVYSSKAMAYIGVDAEPFTSWDGVPPTAIADEVELQDVLLRLAPKSAMTRSFTAAELLSTFLVIDRGAVEAAFTTEEIANPTPALAARLQNLASDIGLKIGNILGDER